MRNEFRVLDFGVHLDPRYETVTASQKPANNSIYAHLPLANEQTRKECKNGGFLEFAARLQDHL